MRQTWRMSCIIPLASACALKDMYWTESFTSIYQKNNKIILLEALIIKVVHFPVVQLNSIVGSQILPDNQTVFSELIKGYVSNKRNCGAELVGSKKFSFITLVWQFTTVKNFLSWCFKHLPFSQYNHYNSDWRENKIYNNNTKYQKCIINTVCLFSVISSACKSESLNTILFV